MTCPQCVNDFDLDDAVTVTKWVDGKEGWHYVDTSYCSEMCVANAMREACKSQFALIRFRTALDLLASEDINAYVNLCEWGMDDFKADSGVDVDIQQMREMAMAILGKMQGVNWDEKRRVA